MAEITNNYLAEVKTMLDLEDESQDPKLKIIIRNAVIQLSNRLLDHPEPIPEKLQFIILELAIKRYNRIASEGMKSDSEEGHTITFYDEDKDFEPFSYYIDSYNEIIKPPDSKARKGKVYAF